MTHGILIGALAITGDRFNEVFSEPLVAIWWLQLLILAVGYGITLGLSGTIIRFFIVPPTSTARPPQNEASPHPRLRFDPSVVIGKCENLITLTFVIARQETGLALIFAAKSLVRSEEIKGNPGFYLGGTLINFVWSLLMGFLLRVLVFGL